MDLRRAPPAPSRERKGRAASASEPRPLRCGGWGTGEKAGLGHGGTGGPPGPYFRATPVPRNSSCVRLRVLDSKGGPFGSPGICLGEISGRSFRFRNRSITCRIASDLPGSRMKYGPGGPPSPTMPCSQFSQLWHLWILFLALDMSLVELWTSRCCEADQSDCSPLVRFKLARWNFGS